MKIYVKHMYPSLAYALVPIRLINAHPSIFCDGPEVQSPKY